jgi:hypothetical protein
MQPGRSSELPRERPIRVVRRTLLFVGLVIPGGKRDVSRNTEYGTNMGREYGTLSITSTSASLTFQENGSGRRYATMGGRCVGRCHPRRPAEVRSARAVETSWAFAIFASFAVRVWVWWRVPTSRWRRVPPAVFAAGR